MAASELTLLFKTGENIVPQRWHTSAGVPEQFSFSVGSSGAVDERFLLAAARATLA